MNTVCAKGKGGGMELCCLPLALAPPRMLAVRDAWLRENIDYKSTWSGSI